MKVLVAFIKKEMMEQIRSGKMMILAILFILFGIMNPAIAKLTPWMLEMLSDSLAQSGMVVTSVTVTALDSWMQFFKNAPMALIAFILLESSIFTKEYETGTLILSLTKGLKRYKVVMGKATVLVVLWSFYYWLCFGITYAYNAYFWDNTIAKNLLLSVVCWWLFGIWLIALLVLFSVVASANTLVLVGTGGVVLVSYLLGLFPKIKEYVPTLLMNGNALIYGTEDASTYTVAIIITSVISLVCFLISIPLFDKKHI